MLHSGLDLHKRTLAISTLDPGGRPVRDVQLPTVREAITAYFAALPGGPAAQRAVVESTSTWYWLRDLLTSHGVDLRLAHSKHVKAISYAKVKTDAAAVPLRPATGCELVMVCGRHGGIRARSPRVSQGSIPPSAEWSDAPRTRRRATSSSARAILSCARAREGR